MTALAPVSNGQAPMTIEGSWTPEQVQLIKATVAAGTTDDEFKLFLYTAHVNGLNPLLKEIWCIVRPEKRRSDGTMSARQVNIMTSHQGYINAARRNYQTEYKTVRSFAVHAGDEFEYDAMTQEVRRHVVKGDRGKLIGAWAISENTRGERIGVFLPFGEIAEANSSNPLWRSRPTQMILKTAEVHVLRRMFPITGLYAHEEMDGDFRPPVDVTPPAQASEEHGEPPAEPADQPTKAELMVTPQQIAAFRFYLAGERLDDAKVLEYATEKLGRLVNAFEELTEAEFSALTEAVKAVQGRRRTRQGTNAQGESAQDAAATN